MSPEVLLGDEFDLPTNIFSLGIILCEIVSRQLADDRHSKRCPPTFNIDEDEIRKLASPGCPPDMVTLCLDCLALPQILPRDLLPLTSLNVIDSLKWKYWHVQARMKMHVLVVSSSWHPWRFGMGVGKDIRSSGSSTDDSDDELMKAVMGLSSVGVNSGWSDPTDVPPFLSSILTICASPNPNETPDQVLPASNPSPSSRSTIIAQHAEGEDLLGTSSIMALLTHTTLRQACLQSPAPIRSLHGNYVAPLIRRFIRTSPPLSTVFVAYTTTKPDEAVQVVVDGHVAHYELAQVSCITEREISRLGLQTFRGACDTMTAYDWAGGCFQKDDFMYHPADL
ncbi:hypothetical protein ARMGADRAFT_1146889 [Armillaria gallica]|uniref:Protein kinase domain-containing protein n=1 Tax=Armillaria gallica TaxID=47427 RepID=A0A2H3CD14_ARMGA|nr:hypothetical protein ARMGADRAFT_1146889 [Armillaria gallica]